MHIYWNIIAILIRFGPKFIYILLMRPDKFPLNPRFRILPASVTSPFYV